MADGATGPSRVTGTVWRRALAGGGGRSGPCGQIGRDPAHLRVPPRQL